MNDIFITGGVAVAAGRIAPAGPARLVFDSAGLDVLPGLIDVHGDAFERALQPRPGVTLPLDMALAEVTAQLLSAGITTAFLAITLSWEAGLRSRATYQALRDALSRRPAGAVPDLRLHIRFEAHNLACLELAITDIRAGHVGMLSFNDHTPSILRKLDDVGAAAKFVERSGQTFAAFAADARRAGAAMPAAVKDGQARLAAAARAAGVPMASHDDPDLPTRAMFRELGAKISEFPVASDVARDAMTQGEAVVMGAPNVVRGGSHIGWHGAEALVKDGFCSVLCSDYHYPSLLQSAYIIARNASASFDDAVALVTKNAALMSGLEDRGTLEVGRRADILLVEPGPVARVVAVVAGGRFAYMAPDAMARITATS